MEGTWHFILIVLLVIVASSGAQQDCWWTDCQESDRENYHACDSYGGIIQEKESCSETGTNQQIRYYCCSSLSDGTGIDEEQIYQHPEDPVYNNGRAEYTEPFMTFQQFIQAVTINGYPEPTQEQYDNFNLYATPIGKIATVQESAMALAHFLYETRGLVVKMEATCLTTKCSGQYLYPECDSPGKNYFSRGYIPITYCYNYREASQDLYGDDRLVTDPDQVTRDDHISWQTAFWFWGKYVHDESGVQDGKFGATTRVIHGIECEVPGGNPQAAMRYRIYGRVRQAFGLPDEWDSSGACA